MFLVLWKESKFFIFHHVKSQNEPYFAETEKRPSKFFMCCTVCGKLSEYMFRAAGKRLFRNGKTRRRTFFSERELSFSEIGQLSSRAKVD